MGISFMLNIIYLIRERNIYMRTEKESWERGRMGPISKKRTMSLIDGPSGINVLIVIITLLTYCHTQNKRGRNERNITNFNRKHITRLDKHILI